MAGFGKSKSANFGSRRDFLEQFMKEVKLDRPVLICASMSGSFALPFVLRPEAATCTQRLRGFVPIAPVGTSEFSAADYSSCKVSATLNEHSLCPYWCQTFYASANPTDEARGITFWDCQSVCVYMHACWLGRTYLSPPLLIFLFENRPTPFPGC